MKTGPEAAAASSANVRVSNGLKEFLWLITDSGQGKILDLGAVFQSTVMFFIEKGFRLSTEDLLRSWKEFLLAEEESLRNAPVGDGNGTAASRKGCWPENFWTRRCNIPKIIFTACWHGTFSIIWTPNCCRA